MIVGAARRLCRYGYRTAALYADDHLGSVDLL